MTRLLCPLYFTLVSLLTVGFSSLAAQETASHASSEIERFFGYIHRLDRKGIGDLEKRLEALQRCIEIGPCQAAADIRDMLFQEVEIKDFADVLIHLRHEGRSGLQLTQPVISWNGKVTPHLYGREHIWVLVFSRTKPELKVSLLTRYQQPGNPFVGLLALFSVNPPESKSGPEEPEERKIDWLNLNSDPAPKFYLGWARLPVKPESLNHMTVWLKDPGTADEFAAVSVHFSNSNQNRGGFAISVAATLNTRGTAFKNGDQGEHLGGYALGKLYLRRPRVQIRRSRLGRLLGTIRPSVALAVGTDIAGGNDFDEFVVGLSIGHIFGKAGIFIGANHTPTARATFLEGDEEIERLFKSKWRLIVGGEYSF